LEFDFGVLGQHGFAYLLALRLVELQRPERHDLRHLRAVAENDGAGLGRGRRRRSGQDEQGHCRAKGNAAKRSHGSRLLNIAPLSFNAKRGRGVAADTKRWP
jgi:hypothetical protein